MADEERGSDALMTEEQRKAMNERLDLQLAEDLEEDRKTAAQPEADDEPSE